MSSDNDQNKSEEASQYKLEQARKKGMLPRSQELGVVFSVVACIAYLWMYGGDMALNFAQLNARALAESASLVSGGGAMLIWMRALLLDTAHIIAPLIGMIVLGTLLSALLQAGFLFAPDALKVDWSKLNPSQGFKRIFSVQTLIEAAKTFTKMVVHSSIAYWVIADAVVTYSHTPLQAQLLAHTLLSTSIQLVTSFVLAAVIFAVIDQIIQRRAFAKKMRMSRYDQKQEAKQRDGDPRIKQRRKQLARELLQRAQSMRSVRGADVVVTNPTHFAVGLKYDAETMAAPTVIAKGTGDFALRLRRIAFIYGVPVIESPAFARQLFYKSAIDREVPEHLYSETAAVYLRTRKTPSMQASSQ